MKRLLRPFVFSTPLLQGNIISRPNRFVMMVENMETGTVERCHCPVTGNIGYLDFDRGGIPCLISRNTSRVAKTSHTVEAISLDHPTQPDMSWIGINQNKANKYVEHFISEGLLASVQGESTDGSAFNVKREVTLGKSRIDILVNGNTDAPHLIEVKTPLNSFDTSNHPNFDPIKRERAVRGSMGDRLSRHMNELAGSMTAHPELHPRATLMLVFMYDAQPFVPPTSKPDILQTLDMYSKAKQSRILEIIDSSSRMQSSGVTTWQLNIHFTRTDVKFLSFTKLDI